MNILIRQAIKIVGSQRALADELGVSQQHVNYWLHRAREIPAHHVLSIERATKGEVSRYEQRPDIYKKDG